MRAAQAQRPCCLSPFLPPLPQRALPEQVVACGTGPLMGIVASWGPACPLPCSEPGPLLPEGHRAGCGDGAQGRSPAGPCAARPRQGGRWAWREPWGGLIHELMAQGWAGVSSPGAGKGKVLNALQSPAGSSGESSGTAGTCRADPSCDHRGQVGEVRSRGAQRGTVGLCQEPRQPEALAQVSGMRGMRHCLHLHWAAAR